MPESVLEQLMPGKVRISFLETYKEGVQLFKRLLVDNLKVTSEQLLIISDHGLQGRHVASMVNVLYAEAAMAMGLSVSVVIQNPKLHGDRAEQQVVRALKSLTPGSVILLNVSGRIGNLTSLGLSYRTFCKEHRHRFFSSSNWGFVPDERFRDILAAFSVDFRKLSEEGAKLKTMLDKARTVRITTPAGSDFTIRKEGMCAINNDGFYPAQGMGGNMPAGEVYFPPIKKGVEGRIVIDGSFRTKDASLMPKQPIILEVRQGAIVGMNDTAESRLLEHTLQWAERRARYPWGIRRISELGIGLNPGAKLIGCTILDEKARGTVHIANGSNKWFGGDVAAIIHLDHVLRDPTIYVDGNVIPTPS